MDIGMTKRKRGFEIESKTHTKNVSISNVAHDRVLFEGDIGDLEGPSMVDGEVLEVRGAHGTLRIDLMEDEIRRMIAHPSEGGLSSEVERYTSTQKKR